MQSKPAGTHLLSAERRGEVLVMTMRREEKRNAVDVALTSALDAAFDDLESEPELRVGVLTGAGGFFSAGTDLSLLASPASPDGGEYGFVRRRRTKPVIAAVEGYALGGGFEMVLACDLVVASRDATFGLPEVRRGVVANCGALFRAPLWLPHGVGVEMLLTGEPISAERGHRLGLVARITDPGRALDEALVLAGQIARNSPGALLATMRALDAARSMRESSLWPLTERAAVEAAAHPDRVEGIAAFFERREPRWSTEVPEERT